MEINFKGKKSKLSQIYSQGLFCSNELSLSRWPLTKPRETLKQIGNDLAPIFMIHTCQSCRKSQPAGEKAGTRLRRRRGWKGSRRFTACCLPACSNYKAVHATGHPPPPQSWSQDGDFSSFSARLKSEEAGAY
jgi:hypothetical protein